MLRKVLMGGVAASLLAMNTGCSCMQSFLCHCWNELSPCHWGCDNAFGCSDSCEPCDEYGNWTGGGGCNSCGGGGCNSCASTGGGGGYGPYMAQGQGAPQYAMQQQGPPQGMASQSYGPRMASANGKYGHGDGQIIPGSEVWTEGPAPAGAGSAMMVEAPAAAPAAAPSARYRTAQRTQPARQQMRQPMRQQAVVAQQNVQWAGEARPMPPNRPTRKASYSKFR